MGKSQFRLSTKNVYQTQKAAGSDARSLSISEELTVIPTGMTDL